MGVPRRFPREVASALRRGKVVVTPTDTIYGIVGAALKPPTVTRIYRLRRRRPDKPFIILIPSVNALAKFGIRLDRYRRAFLREAWPGPVSVILPVPARRFHYLHRGKNSLAFRVPDSPALRALLRLTGPLAAPSANWEGKKPARTIKEAQSFFGDEVDFYVDGGRITGMPSTLISLTGSEPVVLRP